jgi:CheY-like chemotaxis protein
MLRRGVEAGVSSAGARIPANGAAIFVIARGRIGPYAPSVMSRLPSRSRPPRVLVVDDHSHVRSMLCEVLMQWGWEADGATSPAEGLDLLERGAYDVLLTDFQMPDMTGVELVERARARSAALRVIMLTGSGADLDLASRRLGFTLLHKPLDLGRLRRALAS